MRRIDVIFIVGPTAIGKTRIASGLAGRIGAQIISADSMQVYKKMRILSQAPTAKEKNRARHHLVEFLDPGKEYSVADFRNKATRIINFVSKKGKLPIVVGGSGLYLRALVDGLFPSPPADMKFRKKMERFILKYGSGRLHERLLKIDPDAAKTIHPNDARRIIRALEIHHLTGRTMTDLKNETRGLKDRYNIKIFGLVKSRQEMYEDIESRTDRMFDAGVVKEVEKLKKMRLSRTAAAVLGYKEISGYLDEKYDLETAKSMMKMNTRRFSKRQMTWFRADKRIHWFDVGKISEKGIIREIMREAMRKMVKGYKEK
jgi:tRNA dimethylallyltransferase